MIRLRAMKHSTRRALHIVALTLVLVFTALGPLAVFAADSGACYSVGDADARAYCLARAHREPSQCYNIQRADVRAMCLAEVRK